MTNNQTASETARYIAALNAERREIIIGRKGLGLVGYMEVPEEVKDLDSKRVSMAELSDCLGVFLVNGSSRKIFLGNFEPKYACA